MGRLRMLIIAAAVLVLSTLAPASSIPDAGGLFHPGYVYQAEATIGFNNDSESFTITFNEQNFSSFDPFSAPFCTQNSSVTIGTETFTGPDCHYDNESGQALSIFDNHFVAAPGAFTVVGGLFCRNGFVSSGPPTFCDTAGNVITINDQGFLISNGADFSALYFGFAGHENLAKIGSSSVNGNTVAPAVPEPASVILLFTGLSAMGLQLKRKNRRKG